MRFVKPGFELLAVDSASREIDEHHMIVRAAADKFQSAFEQAICHCFRVFDDLNLIFLKLG